MKLLVHAAFEEIVEIGAVLGDAGVANRLRELGFRPGVKVRLVGRAPFGGPFLVQMNTNLLALRKDEAECLQIR